MNYSKKNKNLEQPKIRDSSTTLGMTKMVSSWVARIIRLLGDKDDRILVCPRNGVCKWMEYKSVNAGGANGSS